MLVLFALANSNLCIVDEEQHVFVVVSLVTVGVYCNHEEQISDDLNVISRRKRMSRW